MWSNIKSFTTEVLETAKDIKAHIKEVTAVDFKEEGDSEREHALQEISDHHLYQLNSDNQRLRADLQRAEETYRRDVEHLSETINDMRGQLTAQSELLKAKEAEVDWASQSYITQVQDLVKTKNRLQTDLTEALEETKELPALREEARRLAQDLEESKRQAEAARMRVEEEEVKVKALRTELEKWQREEHIDRGFFLQFLEMYHKNIANFRIREEMLQSLVTSLALSPAEQERLGIEPKAPALKLPAGLQASLFDSFKQFLLEE